MTISRGINEHSGDVKVLEVEPTVTVQEYDIHENGIVSGRTESPSISNCTSYTIVADDLPTGVSSYEVAEPSGTASAASSPRHGTTCVKDNSRDIFIRTFKTLVDIVDEPMQDGIQSILTSEDDDDDDDDNGASGKEVGAYENDDRNPLSAIYSKSKTMLEALTVKSADANGTNNECAESWSLKGLVKWL